MATPIVEDIAADIATKIALITTGAGFQHTLTVLRPKTITYKAAGPTDKQVVVRQGQRTKLNEASLAIAWEQIFELTCWVTESEDAATSIETKINQIVADIEKKLTEDVQRASNADNTRLLGAEPIEDDAGTGTIVTIAVDYKVLATDPYIKK